MAIVPKRGQNQMKRHLLPMIQHIMLPLGIQLTLTKHMSGMKVTDYIWQAN
jgi:hypothetical protein